VKVQIASTQGGVVGSHEIGFPKEIIVAKLSNRMAEMFDPLDKTLHEWISVSFDPFGTYAIHSMQFPDGSRWDTHNGYLSHEQVNNRGLSDLRMMAEERTSGRTVPTKFSSVDVPIPVPESDPFGKRPHEAGSKLDAGKSPIVSGFMKYFPRAIRAVANVSLHGMEKYTWKGWIKVPDGIKRYDDAEGRHIVDEEIDGPIDPKSRLLHAAHRAWNAMARLELLLIQEEEEKSNANGTD
jgi:hypothetical protein